MEARNAAAEITGAYPAITGGSFQTVISGGSGAYFYYIRYQPKFLMTMLAYAMGGGDKLEFAGVVLPSYLSDARNAITAYAFSDLLNDALKEPHYVESYYLLATKTT